MSKVTHRVVKGENDSQIACDVGALVKNNASEDNSKVTCKKCLKIIATKDHWFFGNKLNNESQEQKGV